MGKGFNRAKNKQAGLLKKLESARKDKAQGNETGQEISLAVNRDREEFEKLLATSRNALPSEFDAESDSFAPITAGQNKKNIKKPKPPQSKASKVEVDEKQSEKVPQRLYFEDLIDVESSKPLGPINAARLVPWVPPYLTDCLVVFVDPRTNSGDLRQTLKYLTSTLDVNDEEKFTQQVAFVCAENVPELKSWLRRSEVQSRLRMFSDPELKFMTAYGLVGGDDADYRWSMSMLVFDTNGTKPKVIRDVDPSHASQMALKAMKEHQAKT
jgi:hypothetical protein